MSTSVYTQTYDLLQVTQALMTVIKKTAAVLGATPKDVVYGDQIMPRTPSVTLEPLDLSRELEGASFPPRTRNTYEVAIMIYIQEVTSVSAIDIVRDTLLNKLQDLLNADWTLGQLLVFGSVVKLEPGYVKQGNRLLRAGRATYVGMNKSFLLPPTKVKVP